MDFQALVKTFFRFVSSSSPDYVIQDAASQILRPRKNWVYQMIGIWFLVSEMYTFLVLEILKVRTQLDTLWKTNVQNCICTLQMLLSPIRGKLHALLHRCNWWRLWHRECNVVWRQHELHTNAGAVNWGILHLGKLLHWKETKYRGRYFNIKSKTMPSGPDIVCKLCPGNFF